MTDIKYQYWLAEVDSYGTGWMKDGPHSNDIGVKRAYELYKKLGFASGKSYAIARVELLPVTEEKQEQATPPTPPPTNNP